MNYKTQIVSAPLSKIEERINSIKCTLDPESREINRLENNQYKYYITRQGVVCTKRKRDNKVSKKRTFNKGGYPQIRIRLDGKERQYSVHRLVAEAFIPNPDNKPQVNHIDGNKQNPSADNLEWVTAKENVRHAVEVLDAIPRKQVHIICKIRKCVIDTARSGNDGAKKYGVWTNESHRGESTYGNLIAVGEEEYLNNTIDDLIRRRVNKRFHRMRGAHRKYNLEQVKRIKNDFLLRKGTLIEFCKENEIDPKTLKSMLDDTYFTDSKYHQKKRRTAKSYYSGVLRIEIKNFLRV